MQSYLLNYAELFAADVAWLSQQPGMGDYQDGCTELVEEMSDWIKECAADTCGEPIDLSATQNVGCLRRVWGCWRHHWRKAVDASPNAVANRHDVAEVIRGQRPPAGKGEPGADLIRDVVLVESVLMGNEGAINYFDRVHSDLVDRLVVRFDPSLQSDRCWWQDTKSRLFGTPEKAGQLKRFVGAGSLHGFMETAIKRDLCRESKKLQREREKLKAYGESVAGIDDKTPSTVAETRDCHTLFRNAWREALDGSPASDRGAAKLVLVNGLNMTEAAAVLNKDKGTISKTLKRVYRRFRDIIYQPNGDFSSVFRDCGEHLFGESDDARGLLRELFKEETVEESQP